MTIIEIQIRNNQTSCIKMTIYLFNLIKNNLFFTAASELNNIDVNTNVNDLWEVYKVITI